MLLVAQVSNQLAVNNTVVATGYLNAWATPDSVLLLNPPGSPTVLIARFGSYCFVVFGSFGNTVSWVQNYLPPPFVANLNGSGQVLPVLQSAAWAAYQAFKATATYPTLKLIFTGHGLGGAIAQLAAYWANHDGLILQGSYAEGAPRGYDATFGAGITGLSFQFENTQDPVVALMPVSGTTITGLPTSWAAFATLPAAAPLPSPVTIDASGQIIAGTQAIAPDLALQAIVANLPGSHAPTAYVSRLMQGGGQAQDLVAGANGYASPWILYNQLPPGSGGGFTPGGFGGKLNSEQIAAQQNCLFRCPQNPGLTNQISTGG